jgi:hypothetical protein
VGTALTIGSILYGGYKDVMNRRQNNKFLQNQLQDKVSSGDLTNEEAQYEYFRNQGSGLYQKMADQMQPTIDKIRLGKQDKIMQTANLQTEAQRQIMNRQLNENINTLNINKAGMGAYRTGGRIKDIEKMQTTMNEDVARVAQANSLNAMLAGMGLKQSQQQLDIQMAQLELAKQAGDTDMMSGIAEQIGGSDFFSKLLGGNKGESVPSNPSPYGQTESNLNSAPSSYNNAIGTQPNTLTLADYIMPSQSGVSIPSQDNYNLYSGQGTGFNAPYSTVDYGIQSSGLTSEEAIGFTDTEWDDWWGRQY